MRRHRARVLAAMLALLLPCSNRSWDGRRDGRWIGSAAAAPRSLPGPSTTSRRKVGHDPLAREQVRLQRQRALAAAQSDAARSLAERAAGLRDQARRKAEADARRAAALSQQTVQAARHVQQTERQAGAAADRTADLSRQRDAAAAALADDARALAPLLPVVERLALYPSETLLAAPFDTADALTGIAVLHGLGRTLEQRAEIVARAQAHLAALGSQLDAEQARLAGLQRDQAAQQAALQTRTDAARAEQAASAHQADQAARQAASAASRAATLDDAVAQIAQAEHAAQQRFEQQAEAAERASQPAVAQQARDRAARLEIPAGPGLQGNASAPVAGRVVQKFGDATDAGAATGMRYAPPSRATVTAPCAGRVDFAGPFRSYGQMLILDCGRDDRFVLAGFGGIDVQVGQNVARGGQLGHMPAWGDAGDRPGLYVQLRHGDRTIDPARFLLGG